MNRGAAKELGLELDSKLVVDLKRPNMVYGEGYKLTKRLLKNKRSFSAVFAFDDMTACGVIRALTEEGLSVPENCSVVGFDDLPTSAFYNPPLTTVRQPMNHLGDMGVAILLDSIKESVEHSEFLPQHRQLEPDLVVRGSTGPVKN